MSLLQRFKKKSPKPDFNGGYKDPARRPSAAGSEGDPARVQWGGRIEFLLSCISLSVGLGNVWRFPYVAYENGGGAFLLPYVIVLVLVGRPMYFMEIAFGQFQSEGPVKVWKRSVPLARGIGLAQVIVNFCVSVFYIIIMVWTMFYFWATFISMCKGEAVPWSTFCDAPEAHKATCQTLGRATEYNNTYVPDIIQFDNNTDGVLKMQSSADQYFERAVTNQFKLGTLERHGLEDMGEINLLLLACLAGCWFLVYLSVVKGVKSSGKVVYITSTLPFLVLLILLGQGASLKNAVEGIKFFIVPKFEQLLDIKAWRAAAEQMFFSLAVGFGSLTMLGSYNRFKHNCYSDALIVSVLDSTTSIVSGFAMFSVLGYLAGELDVGIETVVTSGPGLAFVTFPEAVTQMPVPHLWALLFFIMLFTLGLGSEIGSCEAVLTFFVDRYPKLREKRPWVALVFVSVSFLIGLPFITQGGLDLFSIFNDYAGGLSVLFIATFELILVMWVYGLKRFTNNVEEMLGKSGKMGYYFRSTWIALGPVTLLFILFVSIINYTPTSSYSKTYIPAWADVIGWLISGAAIVQIPIWAIVEVFQTPGDSLKDKVEESMWPAEIMKPLPAKPIQLTKLGDLSLDVEKSEKSGYVNPGYSAKDEQ